MSASRDSRELLPAVRGCLALVSRVRRQLARGERDELARLGPELDRLCEALDHLPESMLEAGLRPDLLALLDEAGQLTDELAAARTRLGAELRATGPRRRAGSAYRRASRLQGSSR